MKNIYFLFLFLLFSCSEQQNTDEHIIPKDQFENILKEIHLAESEFQLNRINNTERYKNKLSSDYKEIFSKYNVSKTDFENTLQYYSERPDLLENIYEKILFNLKEKRTQLN